MDMITDMHQYLYKARVALWGDPDQLVSLCEFLADLDMRPGYIVTGTPGKQFERRIEAALAGRRARGQVSPRPRRRHVPHAPVDQERAGRFVDRATPMANTSPATRTSPWWRHGFPIMDRVGHSYFPTSATAGRCACWR